MDNRTNLDDYLAGLGISDADESALPPPAPDAAPVSAPLHGADEDPRAVLEQFLAELTARIDPGLRVQVRETEDALEAEISGENAARLAGRDGRTLGAIEVIAYAVLAKHAGRGDLRVRVDVGGFRKRQADTLTKLAERLAVQVAKSGEPHELQPMPPAERRVIHIALKENPDVMSESVGEGAARRLVIRPRHG
ncbi:Jag family protein [Deinococcus radiodurans]|jgi:Predicted RNA-binding protein|uniref:Jag-related protein n=1 Tax=Deinococcus radiodurans (strain ATCC 13939 / DSM 20539 / JCM 16871 / CCUG 27074 / LMG 4051 / NBRC 15346 / NCIMB 9279 / VKM B-1422 / R1) TaxID=243230 RepID=Q9RXR1_DEIRA|nr:protein jag [Deinococcus radiodurans]AAF09828.1 Jag-related protein [Deinococcus radiodurans R1 = ATCC 13939 = DSM 20539]ANC72485.1 RNA-binding protein [Deinococcus radiodurans R1 = ATCC 13939 = DSM 20539]QEM72210.1 protein jag [Deinococcus radiodurans]QIP32819.1 protein jag [Deinococcus radiodurans]UDK99444.1 protein jag [Deinococcus radiodurans R1 = ATCC 13939 = DSM 20539]